MYKIATLNKISPVGLNKFTADYEVVSDVMVSDGALVRSMDMHEMELPASFLAVARAGAGVNNIPLDKMADNGIVAFNTPGANANAVKELVIGSMLGAFRNIAAGIAWASTLTEDIAKATEKGKGQFAGHEIKGKTLGVVGLGAIGAMVANAALDLGMNVVGSDPYLSVKAALSLKPGVQVLESMEQVVAAADVITIHVPAMPSTNGMFNADVLAKVKPGAIVLNFSRDKLVDEVAMLKALEEGRIAKYVSDFPNDVVLGKPGVICTPHLGASTEESEENCAAMAATEIMDYLENGNIVNSVNFPMVNLGALTAGTRVLVLGKGVEDLAAKFTAAVAELKVGVVNQKSGARGAVSAVLADVTGAVDAEALKAALGEGVVRVRVLSK